MSDQTQLWHSYWRPVWCPDVVGAEHLVAPGMLCSGRSTVIFQGPGSYPCKNCKNYFFSRYFVGGKTQWYHGPYIPKVEVTEGSYILKVLSGGKCWRWGHHGSCGGQTQALMLSRWLLQRSWEYLRLKVKNQPVSERSLELSLYIYLCHGQVVVTLVTFSVLG